MIRPQREGPTWEEARRVRLPREAWDAARGPGQSGPPTSLEYQVALRRLGMPGVTLAGARAIAQQAGLELADWP